MGWLSTAEVAGAVLVAVLVLPILCLWVRRRWLSSQGGVFDCALLLHPSSKGTGWSTGLARYTDNEVQWFRTFSLTPRPRLVLLRDATTQLGTRAPNQAEAVILFSDDSIMRVQDTRPGSNQVWELAMSPASLTGLMSWLEAAPPGGDAYSGLERR